MAKIKAAQPVEKKPHTHADFNIKPNEKRGDFIRARMRDRSFAANFKSLTECKVYLEGVWENYQAHGTPSRGGKLADFEKAATTASDTD